MNFYHFIPRNNLSNVFNVYPYALLQNIYSVLTFIYYQFTYICLSLRTFFLRSFPFFVPFKMIDYQNVLPRVYLP